MLLVRRMEDSSLRQIYDCRWSMADFRSSPPIGAAHEGAIQGPKRGRTCRDVKNEGTSGDVYENKGKATQCLVTNSASHTKMHQSHANRHQSVGLSGRK
jgi:hypothetical protein